LYGSVIAKELFSASSGTGRMVEAILLQWLQVVEMDPILENPRGKADMKIVH
jgi:hypothetical protein